MNAPRATVVAATFLSFLLFSVALHAAPPSNDNFASRINLAGPSGIATGTTLDATYETGEPEHDPYGCGENSVWWKWTAPSSGTFTFDLAGSTTTVVLAVYTGSALAGLQRVGYTSHHPSGEPGWLQFNATAGTTYQIAVAGQSHFGGGTVILRRYPDSLSGWFTGYVATGMNNAVSCGIDGSMVVMQVHEIYSLVHRTNRYGYILTDATGVQAISNIVVRDKRDRVIATADALPGNSRRYIHDVNKHGVLMTDIAASSLLVYAVRKGTLELVAERVFPTWFSAFFEGKDILVSLEDHSTGVCSLQVFDRKLEKVKWEVPPGTGFFNWARSRGFMGSIPNYRNGTVYRITEIGDTLSADVTRRGNSFAEFIVPVTYGSSELRYRACDKGSFLFWYAQGNTNGGVSVLSPRGDFLVNDQPLPDAGFVWESAAFNGKRFYAVVIDGTNHTLTAYKIGSTLIRQGGISRNSSWFGTEVCGSRVFVQQFGPGTIGFDVYNASLRRRRGGVPPAPFNVYSTIGEGIYLRFLSGPTEDTYTIEGAKGVIATHVVPHWP